MVPPAVTTDDENFQAATLAAAILRFQEPLAHLSTAFTPAGVPVIGVDAYRFPPSPGSVLRDDVPAFLAGLPSPAAIAATTMRGVYTLVLLDELSGARRTRMQHELDNQHTGLVEAAPGPDTHRVLLEFDAEVHWFPLAALRRWTERYGLTVGWNIEPCPEPARACHRSREIPHPVIV